MRFQCFFVNQDFASFFGTDAKSAFFSPASLSKPKSKKTKTGGAGMLFNFVSFVAT